MRTFATILTVVSAMTLKSKSGGKMKFEIKSRRNGSILFSFETESIKLAVEAAVKKGADLEGAYLEGADLKGADLKGAYLKGADLEGADLEGAYLKGADLEGADLEGAYLKGAYLEDADLKDAYLEGADLKGADLKGADLKGADLEGAYLKGAYLKGADLKGADLEGAYIPVIENLPGKILEVIEKPGCTLDMGRVHVCDTTHCIAGWTVHLAGAAGYALEKKLGWAPAASLIWAKSHKGPRPFFHGSNERAIQQLKKCVERNAE
jgi:pentapeptide repeat protein